MFRTVVILWCLSLSAFICRAQSDSTAALPRYNAYQIYMAKPAQQIKQLLYEKDCTPLNGTISDNGKKIIMQGYEPGNKVHVIVIYTDGTEDEFVRSPCFIDPVIL
jgi:Tol biopolymer transport system component